MKWFIYAGSILEHRNGQRCSDCGKLSQVLQSLDHWWKPWLSYWRDQSYRRQIKNYLPNENRICVHVWKLISQVMASIASLWIFLNGYTIYIIHDMNNSSYLHVHICTHKHMHTHDDCVVYMCRCTHTHTHTHTHTCKGLWTLVSFGLWLDHAHILSFDSYCDLHN